MDEKVLEELVEELRDGNFDRAMTEVPAALTRIAAERDALIRKGEDMELADAYNIINALDALIEAKVKDMDPHSNVEEAIDLSNKKSALQHLLGQVL